MTRYKYPRTPHLPISPGASSDDIHASWDIFEGEDIVITEKLDGESFTGYSDGYTHARSIDSRYHESRSWAINYFNETAYLIPPGLRLCGENIYAQHSIKYDNLRTYLMIFSVWQEDRCFSWYETEALCKQIGFKTVPVLYQGKFSREIVENLVKSLDFDKIEGIVVRNEAGFVIEDFSKNVAKYVRRGHVQTDSHWMHQKIIPNQLCR